MAIAHVYIVQSRDTGYFLFPSDTGDVGHTPFVNLAGHFFDRDEAIETALDEIGDNFLIFGFIVEI